MRADAEPDRKAEFLRIFAVYGAALERLAAAYMAARADREDLVQEIAAAIWRALPAYRAESSERTWLYRIAHNVAITAAVKQRRQVRREAGSFEWEPPAAGANAEQQILAGERREQLFAAVRGLPAADRQIVALHLEGLSAAEIETITGIGAGAVATRLSRIRERLRQAVQTREGRHERPR